MSVPVEKRLDDAVDDLISRLELVDVRFVRLHADCFGEAGARMAEMSMSLNGGYRFSDGGLRCRYNLELAFTDEQKCQAAALGISVVLAYRANVDPEPSGEAVRGFMQSYGLYVAWPHLREAVQSLSTRVGLGVVSLGLLGHDQVLTIPISLKHFDGSPKSQTGGAAAR